MAKGEPRRMARWTDLDEALEELEAGNSAEIVVELERERLGEGCYRKRRLPTDGG